MLRAYDFSTNDPRSPVIRFILTATVKPLPDFIGRIGNAVVQTGEDQAGFNVWPVTAPRVSIERGERFNMFFRIKPEGAVSGTLTAPQTADAAPYKLRRDANGRDYWLDVAVGPYDEPGPRSLPISLRISDGQATELSLLIRMNIMSDDLIVIPSSLDFGEAPLQSARSGLTLGRIGVRKRLGSFRLRGVSTTLPFLKLEQQTLIPERNYVFKIALDPNVPVAPGLATGSIFIETDDDARPRVEVPVKIRFTQ